MSPLKPVAIPSEKHGKLCYVLLSNRFAGFNNQDDEVEAETAASKITEERQARELKACLHPLKNKYVFWYTHRTPDISNPNNL